MATSTMIGEKGAHHVLHGLTPPVLDGRTGMSDPTPEVGQVTVTVDDLVATILLDRPAKHNALTPEMIDQLDAVLAQLDADRTVRAVVVAGAGDRSFCAGADIKRFKALAPLDMWASWTRRGLRVFDRLADLRQPTIAAVSGNAYGGGPGDRAGLRPAGHGRRRDGRPDRDRDRRAAGLGRDRPTPRPGRRRTGQGDDLHRPAVDRGPGARLGGREPAGGQGRRRRRRHRARRRIIAGKAPVAVQMAKQAIDSGPAYALMEQVASAATAFTDDATEGLASFVEKRPPHFDGR